MSRVKSNRKSYLKRKLNDAGYDTEGLDLHQLEELDAEYKREITMKRKLGEVQKQEKNHDMSRAGIPTYREQYDPSISVDDFQTVISGKFTPGEIKRGLRYTVDEILQKIKEGEYPDKNQLDFYTPKERKIILDTIPYGGVLRGESSLLYGRGNHEYVNLDGKILKRKKIKKSHWNFS